MKKEDYELFIDLIETNIKERIKWLRVMSQQNKNYRLYNSGQIRALDELSSLLRKTQKKPGSSKRPVA